MATTSPQAIAVQTRAKPGQVTGKLKAGIDAMVELGLDFAAAAKHVGLQPSAIRYAMRKPHVLAYFREQCDVLRSGERARNIHRAREIRDAADNMPAIQAIKWLEGEQEQQASERSPRQAAGVTIVIQSTPAVGHTVGQPGVTLDLPAISTDVEG